MWQCAPSPVCIWGLVPSLQPLSLGSAVLIGIGKVAGVSVSSD